MDREIMKYGATNLKLYIIYFLSTGSISIDTCDTFSIRINPDGATMMDVAISLILVE